HGDRAPRLAVGRGQDHGGQTRQGTGLQSGRAEKSDRRAQAQSSLRRRRAGRRNPSRAAQFSVSLPSGREPRVHGYGQLGTNRIGRRFRRRARGFPAGRHDCVGVAARGPTDRHPAARTRRAESHRGGRGPQRTNCRVLVQAGPAGKWIATIGAAVCHGRREGCCRYQRARLRPPRRVLIALAMLRSALLNVMLQAARKAARSLKRDFGEVERLQVSLKGPANFVSAADRRAEEILYEELAKARPGYGFLGEEGGERAGTDKTNTWIVDPLDGTTNFLHGTPQFPVSIGLERDGVLVAGLIYNPANDELFTAERGKGAFLNDRRLRVAARTRLEDAVV